MFKLIAYKISDYLGHFLDRYPNLSTKRHFFFIWQERPLQILYQGQFSGAEQKKTDRKQHNLNQE